MMELGLNNKIALITGGASGIGGEIVRDLAREGVKIVFTSRDEKRGTALQDSLIKENYNVKFLNTDISKDGTPQEAVKFTENNFGEINILINNVGSTLNITDPFCSLEDWRKLYRLNLEVHIELSNLVIPKMIKNNWGRILNITAGAALENSGPVPYSTFKSAYTAYTRSMARVLAKSGIVMSAILPGVVLTETGHWENVLRTNPDHASKYLEERTVLGRFGKPNEITPFVKLLVSDLASFAVGSIIPVEGGQARHYMAGNRESYI